MLVRPQSYNDFKTLVSNMSLPTVYVAAGGFPWQAIAINDELVVALNIYGDGPASFGTDFSAAISLEQILGFE